MNRKNFSSWLRSYRNPATAFLIAACLIVCSQQTVLAQSDTPKMITEVEGITEYVLDNGAEVLLFPDSSKPEFTLNVTVLVGSRHEGYGEAGMAHLLEHLLFKGTDLHPDIPTFLKDRGVLNMNGTTSVDRTNYYETLPSTGDNLEFAIKMEADRLVNSWVKGEDLLSEMTVVRSEFERGENSPIRILLQRMYSASFEWHNYGKSTIGNRSDIERVPIENLRKFYRKHYQPDNIMIALAGDFDPKEGLALIQKHFGAIPKPDRTKPELTLPKTYTEEPAQDGERKTVINRTGDTQWVGLAYHIPSASHPDYAPLQVLTTILSDVPSGDLYKSLVKKELASQTFSMIFPTHDPGLMFAFAMVGKDKELDISREALVANIEKIGKDGVSEEALKRAVVQLMNQRKQQFSDTSSFAVDLSEWRSYGDWRLYFLHRDRLEKVTIDDVKRVAAEYLIPSNRTVGMFIPDEKPVRATIAASPDVKKALDGYKGREKMAEGENFDPSTENIAKRTTMGQLDSGIKYAFLPKKTRGETVVVSGQLHYGDENSLKGKIIATELLPQLLDRGTENMGFQQFQDRLSELEAQIRFGGSTGDLTFSIETKSEFLPEVLKMTKDALRSPSLDPKELEIVRRQMTMGMKGVLQDPRVLSQVEMARKLNPYPADDVRYSPTLPEAIEMIEKVTIDDIREIQSKFLNGQNGEVSIVGDFDADTVLPILNDVFAGWTSEHPYTRIEQPANMNVAAETVEIKTPDKKDAAFRMGINIPISDSHQDYEALLVGNYIIGGGPLSSRLADEVRKKKGLSYTVNSSFRANSSDERGEFSVFANSKPSNTKLVQAAVNDELQRIYDSGVETEELSRAVKSYLENRKGGRAMDARLAGLLRNNLENGRTMDFQKTSDDKISVLTKEQVDAALKKYLDPRRAVIVKAGDFDKAAEEEAAEGEGGDK